MRFYLQNVERETDFQGIKKKKTTILQHITTKVTPDPPQSGEERKHKNATIFTLM